MQGGPTVLKSGKFHVKRISWANSAVARIAFHVKHGKVGWAA